MANCGPMMSIVGTGDLLELGEHRLGPRVVNRDFADVPDRLDRTEAEV
jgi:hypothetical protein